MTPALILAAGRSSRMGGRDKLLEVVGGEPLLRRMARQAAEAGAEVFVALGPKDAAREAALAGTPATILRIPQASEGMGATIREGVAALPPCARFLLCPADLPELTAEDFGAMLSQPAGEALIWQGVDEDGRAGHPVLFDAALRPAFARLAGDTGARGIIAANRDRWQAVPLPGHHATRDLDTPEAWAAWRAARG